MAPYMWLLAISYQLASKPAVVPLTQQSRQSSSSGSFGDRRLLLIKPINSLYRLGPQLGDSGSSHFRPGYVRS